MDFAYFPHLDPSGTSDMDPPLRVPIIPSTTTPSRTHAPEVAEPVRCPLSSLLSQTNTKSLY